MTKKPKPIKLTDDERTILREMQGGWVPLMIQICTGPNSLGHSLEQKGLIHAEHDDKGRPVYLLTDAGRAMETK